MNQSNALAPAMHNLNFVWFQFLAILNKIDHLTFTTHVRHNLLDRDNPAGKQFFQVNNRCTRTWCEICSKLTIKTSYSSVFTNYFEQAIVCREIIMQPLIGDILVISISVPHQRHLLAQSQQQKQQNKISDMFQVNSN